MVPEQGKFKYFTCWNISQPFAVTTYYNRNSDGTTGPSRAQIWMRLKFEQTMRLVSTLHFCLSFQLCKQHHFVWLIFFLIFYHGFKKFLSEKIRSLFILFLLRTTTVTSAALHATYEMEYGVFDELSAASTTFAFKSGITTTPMYWHQAGELSLPTQHKTLRKPNINSSLSLVLWLATNTDTSGYNTSFLAKHLGTANCVLFRFQRVLGRF